MIRTFLAATAAVALASGAAFAADLPRRQAPPVFTPVPVFAWTGFYIGTHTGYAFSDRQVVRTRGNNNGTGGVTNTIANVAQTRRPPALSLATDDFTNFGGGAGYNFQLTPGTGFVFGAEADWTWTDLARRRAYVSATQVPGDLSIFRQNLEWLGTVRGRLGYAFDRLLVFGTGGFAYGDVTYNARFFQNTTGLLAYRGRYSDIETGYVYGGGIEYALPEDSFFSRFNLLSLVGIRAEAITLKVEYLRYDLGRRSVLVDSNGPNGRLIPNGPSGSYTSRFNTEGSIVRAGFNYKFAGY